MLSQINSICFRKWFIDYILLLLHFLSFLAVKLWSCNKLYSLFVEKGSVKCYYFAVSDSWSIFYRKMKTGDGTPPPVFILYPSVLQQMSSQLSLLSPLLRICVYRISIIVVFSLPQGPENFELWSTKRNWGIIRKIPETRQAEGTLYSRTCLRFKAVPHTWQVYPRTSSTRIIESQQNIS